MVFNCERNLLSRLYEVVEIFKAEDEMQFCTMQCTRKNVTSLLFKCQAMQSTLTTTVRKRNLRGRFKIGVITPLRYFARLYSMLVISRKVDSSIAYIPTNDFAERIPRRSDNYSKCLRKNWIAESIVSKKTKSIILKMVTNSCRNTSHNMFGM